MLKRLDHNIMALTACRIAIVPHERLTRLTEEHPHLTRMYWFSTTLDAAIHREWELSLGRRSALSRTAQFFCEMHVRLGLVGLADRSGYPLGITQIDLAECLGMTSVHINRTLKELREQGVVEFRRGRVAIGDLDGLRRVAEFDPAFLYLERKPQG
jgi:CRP-like cAMP-binding protein